MGDGHYPSLWIDFFTAVPFRPWVEFALLFFLFLIRHVVLMQNYKTGACECEYIFWSVSDSHVWIQKTVYSSDWTSTCYMGAYIWAGSYWSYLEVSGYSLREPENTLVWLEIWFIFTVSVYFPVVAKRNQFCVHI